MSSPFEVDPEGLSQLIEDQGQARLIAELVRNPLDEEGVTKIDIRLDMEPGRPLCRIEVVDDAVDGFADLSHAYTLFAPSWKKAHPDKAGRFNVGEKLFLAAALRTGEDAVITSTSGTIVLSRTGRSRKICKTERGSKIVAYLRMTREEHADVLATLWTLLIPPHVAVTINGTPLPSRVPIHEFAAKLPTVIADEGGNLRGRLRDTVVRVYEPAGGEKPCLYELGIPVVETGDRWHLDVAQKVPLNIQRDNIQPAYLRLIRTLTVNAMADRLTKDDAPKGWVREAASDPKIEPEVMKRILNLRFGEKRVTFDPNDGEANKRAVAEGFTVISGGMLSGDEWDNVRATQTTPPSGQVFPSAKPYSDDPSAKMVQLLNYDEWTDGMKRVADFAKHLHLRLFNRALAVRIDATSTNFAACYCPGELTFALRVLGHKWFTGGHLAKVTDLIIHELGHWFSGDHLSERYYHGLTEIGGRLFALAVRGDPELERLSKDIIAHEIH